MRVGLLRNEVENDIVCEVFELSDDVPLIAVQSYIKWELLFTKTGRNLGMTS